jgi:para-nitrobenzyl esterase
MHEHLGEDCLVLNVLTPQTGKGSRPVLVQFHGGGYATGSGALNTLGEGLVTEQDVVLVTVNHRLNVMGFLYLGDLSPRYAQGNPSLLDLVASLQWVRDNIENFGGDPSRVTIFGESGGGGKVGLMLAMPQAKGLFHRAIMESSAFPAAVSRDEATKSARDLLAKLSISPDNLSALNAVPFASLLANASQGIGPVEDGQTLKGPLWKNGAPASGADVPLIVGVCADEESIFSAMRDPAIFQTDWAGVSVHLNKLTGVSAAALDPCIAAYRAVYPNEDAPSIALRMLTLAGNGLGRFGRDIADAKALQPAPVYYYRNEFDTRIAPGIRAFHTSEQPLACRMVADPRAEGLSKVLSAAWAGFARTGNPNHAGVPQWPRYRSGSPGPMIIFNDTSRAVTADPEYQAQLMLRAALQQAPPRR